MIAATNNEDDIVQFLCDYPGNPTLNLDIKVKLLFRICLCTYVMSSKNKVLIQY